MPARYEPPITLRRAAVSELGLISHLRLASLLCLEMPGRALDAVGALLKAAPDLDAPLLASGRYIVVDRGGELIAGGGWSLLPLGFRNGPLSTDDGRPARVALDERSVLLRGFFLDPDLGRQGAAAALLAQLGAEAAAAGHSAFEAMAAADAHALYAGLGFRTVRRLQMKVDGERLDLVQMRKALVQRLPAAA